MKFRLSPTFMMTVLAVIALVPLVMGISKESLVAAALLAFGSAFLVQPGTARYTGMRSQLGKVGEADIEQQYTEVKANLKEIGDQLRVHAEQAAKDVARHKEMSQEARAKVDELLLKQGELQARMQEAEQKLVSAGTRDQDERQESAGALVAAKLKEEGVGSGFRGSRRVEVPRAAITSVTGSGGDLVPADRRPGVLAIPERRLTIRDLVAPGTTGSNSIEYVRESGFTNNAAIVAEGAQKPYSDLTFELETANVRTIAHLFKGSRQILDDAAALQSFIDARARYGLLLAEEAQMLYGNGTGNNIAGIVPQAQEYAAPAGVTVTAEQRIDRIRLALLQATLAEFPSTGIVLHPIDWALIELLKDGENRYLIGRPQEGTSPRLWNLPVVETQAMVQNDFLVGAFSLAAQIFDRMGIEVLVSTENADDFEKNMVTIRAEERLAFAVYRPEAFVTGPLTGA